jgi:hypothetical protein
MKMLTEDSQEIEYRLHYNTETGVITMASQANHPVSESYIVVSKEQYEDCRSYMVVNGKLMLKPRYKTLANPIRLTDTGRRTVKNCAGIILMDGEDYDEVSLYGQ